MFNDVIHGMGRLLAYFYDLIPNYGVGIILLTILVRLAMIPLAIKQAHIMEANRGNAEKMRKLLPEVKKIKEKYRDDKARQYEEQKKLYDQHGVNMLGGLSGCLPMLVQMPVFLAMYQVLSGCNKVFGSGRTCTLGFHLPNGSDLKTAILDGRASFLGMNLNLQPSEVLQNVGLLRALPYYLLIAVMGYTMWYQTRQMMKAQPVVDPQMAQTQKIMQFMPLLLVFASFNFPAGLTVYWSATNIWSIAQQYVLMRKVGPLSVAKDEPKVAAGGPLKGLADRLKAAMPATRLRESTERETSVKREPAAEKPARQTPKKAPQGRPKPAAQRPQKVQAKPSSNKPATQGAKENTSGKSAGDKTAEPEVQTSPAKAAAPKPAGQGARKAPVKNPPGKPGGKQPGGAAGRRPAASRARAVPANKPGQPKTAAKGPAKAESTTAGRPAGTSPGRPKGSGARKKRQGR